MPKFFFDLFAGTTVRDEEGMMLPDVMSARSHAAAVARELQRNSPYTQREIVVRDATGTEMFRISVDVD